MITTRFPYIFLLVLLLLAGWSVAGQSYYFKHYQVENGLSNNTVFCSVQDSHGFLWLGTKDGLDRFNGYSFKEYRSSNNAFGLGDSFIRSLYLDANNGSDTLYLGTRIGVYSFDPISEHFNLIIQTKGEVDAIQKDGENQLWIIANKELYCYNLHTRHLRKIILHDFMQATAICLTGQNQLWIATAEGKLLRKTPQAPNPAQNLNSNYHFISFDLFKEDSHQSPKWIEKLYETRQGKIMVGTSSFGVKCFDPVTEKTKSIFIYNKEHNGVFARDFKQVSDSEIWIASESGLFIYQIPSGKLLNLTQKTGDPYSLSDNAVYTLSEDKEGGLWAGTYSGGLNYYPRQYNTFTKYFAGQGNGQLMGNVVREICMDHLGQLWVGTEDAGLNMLNLKTGNSRHFMATGKSTDIAYPNIHGLLALGDTLLVGTFEHGLDMLNIRTGKVFAHYPAKNKSKVLKSNFMVTFCHTRSGVTYVGTRLGIYQFEPHSGIFTALLPKLSNLFIHTLMEDKDGNLWIGTMGDGLYRYHPDTQELDHWAHERTMSESLPNNWVTTIFQDSKGTVWIGTEGGGLCHLHSDEAGFDHYTTDNGLPGNTVYKILEDEDQRLWITTSRGLVHFDPINHQTAVYTTANGLLSDQFNYNSGFKAPDGTLYFGCVKGLISFHPKMFTKAAFVPPLYITSVTAGGKEFANWGELLSRKADSTPASIEIPHRNATLTIEFAALGFTAPQMIQYKYKLIGLDKNWTYLKTNRQVYFTNLAPGDYTFVLMSSNSSGHWNGRETKLDIRILPSFWESHLAYFLYFCALAAIAYFLFRNYHDRIAEKNKRIVEQMAHEKEKELYEAKIDFFTHVTHEIKTPLTLIKAPLEKILKQIDALPGIRKYILMMQRNTNRMIDLSGQLLDFRKTEASGFQLQYTNICITKLLQEILSDFKTVAKEKQLSFKQIVPSEALYAKVDQDSFIKIISNLVDNAVKYAVSKVVVELKHEPGSQNFSIWVSNNGTPIPNSMFDKVFEPFYRMETAKSQSGAGLGLSLSRALARMHKGDLELLESADGLIIFVVSLPVQP